MPMPHTQTWVKVNAPVDEGVAELIGALCAFPKLRTIESCQGGEGRPAWVCFQYADEAAREWRGLAEFVLGYLGPGLARQVGDRAQIDIHVRSCGDCHGELRVWLEAMPQVLRALRRLRREFPA